MVLPAGVVPVGDQQDAGAGVGELALAAADGADRRERLADQPRRVSGSIAWRPILDTLSTTLNAPKAEA